MSKKKSKSEESIYLEENDIYRNSLAWLASNPPDPLCFVVTNDPTMGYVDVELTTYFWVTYPPHTVMVKINRYDFGTDEHISDAYQNIKETGEFVLAFPEPHLFEKLWITSLPLPKGINEMEVAGLNPVPSRYIHPPGIQECIVNLECKTLFIKDFYTVGLVVATASGATVHKKVAEATDRDALKWWLYKVDELKQPYRLRGARCEDVIQTIHNTGNRERTDPWVGSGTYREYLRDFRDQGQISDDEYEKTLNIIERWTQVYFSDSKSRDEIKEQLVKIGRLMMEEQWEELHNYLKVLNAS